MVECVRREKSGGGLRLGIYESYVVIFLKVLFLGMISFRFSIKIIILYLNIY